MATITTNASIMTTTAIVTTMATTGSGFVEVFRGSVLEGKGGRKEGMEGGRDGGREGGREKRIKAKWEAQKNQGRDGIGWKGR